jgi:hypothetical protein
MAMAKVNEALDWDKLAPLDEDQVEYFLQLQRSSATVAYVLFPTLSSKRKMQLATAAHLNEALLELHRK